MKNPDLISANASQPKVAINTAESASSLAHTNEDSADAAEESVEEMFEGSDDADFFHCGDFYT